MVADRFQEVMARIDQANSKDPNKERAEGQDHPRELAYAKRLSHWVTRLRPQASEWLKIAARGQHIRRWDIPRENYPRNRAGYLKWRETLKAFHAKTVGELMRSCGYTEEEINRTASLIQKKRPLDDPEQQALEDGLCLIFLETQLAETRRKVTDETMQGVIRKTWAKMSPQGRQEALKLPINEEQQFWLKQVLDSV